MFRICRLSCFVSLMFSVVVLLIGHVALAQPEISLVLNPDTRDIRLDSEPQNVVLTCRIRGEYSQLKWKLKGKGRFEGDVNRPIITYIPPASISKKLEQTIITVTVTDDLGHEVKDGVLLTLLDPTVSSVKQEFTLNVNPDKTRYKIDEQMNITIRTETDGFLWLFIEDAEGNITQIFPNEWQENNEIKAGAEVKVPRSEYDFRITMSEPTGHERLIAIACTENSDTRDKGVKVEAPITTTISEAIVEYEITK